MNEKKNRKDTSTFTYDFIWAYSRSGFMTERDKLRCTENKAKNANDASSLNECSFVNEGFVMIESHL